MTWSSRRFPPVGNPAPPPVSPRLLRGLSTSARPLQSRHMLGKCVIPRPLLCLCTAGKTHPAPSRRVPPPAAGSFRPACGWWYTAPLRYVGSAGIPCTYSLPTAVQFPCSCVLLHDELHASPASLVVPRP